MKIKKILIPSILTLLICIMFLLFWWLQPNKSLYDQIDKAVLEADSDFSKLIHVHVDRERTVAFYMTNKTELGIVLLQEKFRGYKVKDYIDKSLMFTDKGISWHGSEVQKLNIHLLYGVVQDPEITQVILISEGNKAAHIITEGSRIWYALIDETLKNPITIRATNKAGKILYETGDVEFWSK
ncbi:hypothetical protein [Paenibacillus radicis (ex Xue et al. 2023)]|uniref:DUF5590 domain-containing protein n=1 Tax=Paenibacillus radicis (ex Xue et al. 2023) TaxID=2972489 RepID=A0ABT1YHT0_9BACL|nr:hypothetical protein [Paenibacillus radicis (ex Xue et al. 2023)]MCR8631979.1 hypothetical protein [Paenibacillus radicis (ex Xue et al. 2023)]